MPAFFFKGMGIRRWSAMLRFDKLGPTRRLILGAFATTLIVSITAKLLISSHQAEAQPASTFNGDAAVMLHFVKPGSTATYEGLMGRLGEALHKNQNEETKRQAQAAGWKVYRAGTDISGQGSVMYAWVIDPVIDGADYAASTILSEAFPAEVPQFHETYAGSLTDAPLRQLPINLSLVEAQPMTATSERATLLLHFVKRGLGPAYENVIRRLGEALQESRIKERQVQAFGWKAFRAVDNITGRDNAMYVWFIDPVVEGTSDTVSKIMKDALPTGELEQLFDIYDDSLAEVEQKKVLIDLWLVEAF